MLLRQTLLTICFAAMCSSCAIHTIWPLSQFEVEPYARSLSSTFEYGRSISVVLDPLIQQIQLTQLENGNYSERFAYSDYRASLERSVRNMLDKSFQEVNFINENSEAGLVLKIHRVKPKMRFGEMINEHASSFEFLFDYDMSLSYNGQSISSASGLNAHPTASYNIRKSNWQTASQTSLKLVLEECYDKLFVVGLAKR